MKLRIVAWALGVLLRVSVAAAESPRLEASPNELGVPFDRYTTRDSFGRTITFYLSPARSDAGDKRPVVLLILGSGCQSLFSKRGDAISGGYQNPLRDEAKGAARVLVVEKPGVKFLDAAKRPGSAEGASEEFLREHTLERWAEANAAALRAAWTLPGIDLTRTLLIGHSEGGIVVGCVTAKLPQVTHVASLAGGGPAQLFDLAETRSRARPDDKPGDAERRRQAVYDEWARIQRDPDSISEFWLGHPYRRWSTFVPHSVTEFLLQTKARVFLVQGTADVSVSVKSFDVLVAELKSKGRDVTAERLEGADHGFNFPDASPGGPPGMRAVFAHVLKWFLE